jgi:hypothetical protein
LGLVVSSCNIAGLREKDADAVGLISHQGKPKEVISLTKQRLLMPLEIWGSVRESWIGRKEQDGNRENVENEEDEEGEGEEDDEEDDERMMRG